MKILADKKTRFEDFKVKYNQESVEKLFQHYEKVGFLYPEKMALLAPHMSKIISNWKKLLGSKEEFLWIFSRECQNNNNFSSVCAWKQSNFGMHAQHLVSDGNPLLSLKVMLACQFKAEHHYTKGEVNASQNWFRPNNRYAYRVFGSMYHKLGPEKAGLRVFHYLTLPLNQIPIANSPMIETTTVTGIDLELINFVKNQYGEVFVQAEELNQKDLQLANMQVKFQQYGLQRYRRVLKFSCKKTKQVVACAVVNRAPLGINFSFLENRVYYILGEHLTPRERIAVLKVMNNSIKEYYQDFALAAIPIVTDEKTAKSLVDLQAQFLRTYMQSIWMRSGFSLWFDHIYSFLRKIESRKLGQVYQDCNLS